MLSHRRFFRYTGNKGGDFHENNLLERRYPHHDCENADRTGARHGRRADPANRPRGRASARLSERPARKSGRPRAAARLHRRTQPSYGARADASALQPAGREMLFGDCRTADGFQGGAAYCGGRMGHQLRLRPDRHARGQASGRGVSRPHPAGESRFAHARFGPYGRAEHGGHAGAGHRQRYARAGRRRNRAQSGRHAKRLSRGSGFYIAYGAGSAPGHRAGRTKPSRRRADLPEKR